MKKNDVLIGETYLVKVASNLVPVTIVRKHDAGGWVGVSQKTGKEIRIKSAQRLRERLPDPEHAKAIHKADQENARVRDERAEADDGMTASERAMVESAPRAQKDAEATQDAKPAPERERGQRGATGAKRPSLLDAAADVLADAGEPLSAKQMVDRVVERGLWTPGRGKTPHATLSSAILREMKHKGEQARFTKVERGKFSCTG